MAKEVAYDVNEENGAEVIIFTSKYDDVHPKFMKLSITKTGVKMDFYDDAELTSTISMGYSEWHQFGLGKGKLRRR